jgi:hypothetical protein
MLEAWLIQVSNFSYFMSNSDSSLFKHPDSFVLAKF